MTKRACFWRQQFAVLQAYYVKVRPLREVSGTTYVGVVRYCKSTVKAK